MSQQRGRLLYIEPNEFASKALRKSGGKVQYNTTWNQEDLNFSVDLQVVVPNRADCCCSDHDFPFNITAENKNGLSQYISFFSGERLKDTDKIGSLTTDYVNASYSEIRQNKISSTDSLGITSVDINFDSHFYPTVQINFTDVRAYSLFMPASEEYTERIKTVMNENGMIDMPGRKYTNFFKAIFHFPYPRFLLTIKGYYGNKVTFSLGVTDFKTSFNGNTGNFDVSISFIGYTYGVYTDIPMNYVLLSPYFDSSNGSTNEYWNSKLETTFKAFGYKGSDDTPLPTFIELKDRYDNIAKELGNDALEGTPIDNLSKYQDEYNLLNNIKNDFEAFCETIGNFENGKKFAHRYKGSVFDVYVVDSNVQPSDIKWDGELARDIQFNYDTFWTQYGTDFSSDITMGSTAILNLYGKSGSTEDNETTTNHLFGSVDKYITVGDINRDGQDWNPEVLNVGSTKYLFAERQVCKGENTFMDGKKNVVKVNVNGVTKNVFYCPSNEITSFFFGGVITDKDSLEKQHREGISNALRQMPDLDDNQWVFIYPRGRYLSEIEQKLQLLTNKKDTTLTEATEQVKNIYFENLGFSLTIENVFRMLFAHIETFFDYYLNKTITPIKNSNRTFNDVGLDIKETDSYEGKNGNTSFCPPFPAVFKKDSATVLETYNFLYPGEKSSTLVETGLTEAIITSAKDAIFSQDTGATTYSDTNTKMSVYYSLKNLYDKWLCSYGNFERFTLSSPSEDRAIKKKRFAEKNIRSKEMNKEFDNFLFVDSFYNDISQELYCNPTALYELIMSCLNGDESYTVFGFMEKIVLDNNLMIRAFPIFSNFYTTGGLESMFSPHNDYNQNESEERNYGNTYVIMYDYEKSKFLEMESKQSIGYDNDGFDLGDSLGNIYGFGAVNNAFADVTDETKLNLSVPAFGVTYGMQNQMYFRGININMDAPVTTDEAIANQLQLSQTAIHGDRQNPVGIGQNMFAIYSNKSYSCTVEMLGCMNIMPMMYFQLNNIPMFKGAYMIIKVVHKIKAGSMVTQFTGVRQSKNLWPLVDGEMLITDLIQRLKMDTYETKEKTTPKTDDGNNRKIRLYDWESQSASYTECKALHITPHNKGPYGAAAKNNNPGNLAANTDHDYWHQDRKNGRWAHFESMMWGIRAWFSWIKRWRDRGDNTIERLWRHYDNGNITYICQLSKTLNYDKDTIVPEVDENNKSFWFIFARACFQKECTWYASDEILEEAWGYYLGHKQSP